MYDNYDDSYEWNKDIVIVNRMLFKITKQGIYSRLHKGQTHKCLEFLFYYLGIQS